MPDKKVITDPAAAADIQKLLVDPRRIEGIMLVTTQDEPPIRGFHSDKSLVLSAWAATNKTCYAVLSDLPTPDLSVHIGVGARMDVGTQVLRSILDHRSSDKPRILAFIQSDGIPQYAPNRSGPRYFLLITLCADATLKEHEVRIVDKPYQLLPEYGADGRRLVECRVGGKKWWQVWR